MIRTLKQAISQVYRLPAADQEQIGRKLLTHVEKPNTFRAEIDKGILSLDAGKGRVLEMEDVLRDKNSRHGGA